MITAEVISMSDIGKNIRDLRDRSGMTQEALAEIIGYSVDTVQAWE